MEIVFPKIYQSTEGSGQRRKIKNKVNLVVADLLSDSAHFESDRAFCLMLGDLAFQQEPVATRVVSVNLQPLF